MAVALEIIPSSSSLDMYGVPNERTMYSVSGHVNITLTPPSSYFEKCRTVRLALESLVVTFEGQSEFLSEETGYTATRLCTISHDLVSAEPLQLSNEGLEDASESCTWSVVFNLTIPGWLPETTTFGERDAGTSYALHASATIRSKDSAPSRSWFSTLCLPLQQQTRVFSAPPATISLVRYTMPASFASTSTTPFPTSHYEVSARPEELNADSRFPREALSKIRVQMSVPECVSREDEKIAFAVRLRTNGLPDAECRRLRVTDFWIEVEQTERYRTRALAAYAAQFPVPGAEEQPPQKPLLRPHPMHALYDAGLAEAQSNVLSRTFSLLPADCSGHYRIAGDGYIFSRDPEMELDNTWFSLATHVPVATTPQERPADWQQSKTVRTSSLSPLLTVTHRMYVTLKCTYDVDGTATGARVEERLRFHVPLRFVRVPPRPRQPRSSTPTLVGHVRADSASSEETLVGLPPSAPYASTLPAYSQLYYSNGDRKIDYSVPLPLYTPRADAETAPLLSAEEARA
ncbi:hypothetical protein PsYK624_126350 [Phanerochaete sordida]|uniref:Uncharacterized protein n=1 Tax=Phanerochaete sordida TaxID=48140 RepID=A0A9P3GI98_9APHY|nr:hypothetical protein PsYK624_126350 [Phanerochaete sordida]